VSAQLAQVVGALDEVPELDALLSDTESDARAKASVLEEMLSGSDELVRNFLLLLVEKGRADEVREMVEEFDRLAAADERVLDVELTTAVELSDAQFEGILEQIEKKSGRKVSATRSVDSGLIGGIVLQAGSMRLDASVRGRLDRLRQELVTSRSQ
jgi:F-type H+-transporting ATPase subunit delta